MRTHQRHVLMCTGPRCTEEGVLSEALFAELGAQIDARPELRVKRTRTHSMVACTSQAAVLVVYPEGVWYRCKDAAAVQRVVAEHLAADREVSELIFHRLGRGDIGLGAEAPLND